MPAETQLIPNSDLITFSPDVIKRAGELLGCQLDEASILKALIIQQDTGLSITRGEISIVTFGGKPTVFVNKQGYIAYANRQPEYDGYEWGYSKDNTIAWCKVFRKDRTRPVYETAIMAEDNRNTPVWKQMPLRMLAKVAIKRAHQAAFPVLNGLLMPEEVDEGYKIDPRPDDIRIAPAKTEIIHPAPAPAPAHAAEQPKPRPANICTLQIAQTILENMTAKGMDISVFEKAKLPDGFFDRDMIDADFKRQLAAQKTAAPAPAPEPAQPVEMELCADCGKKALPDEAERSTKAEGVVLCEACRMKRLANRIKTEHKCSQCGAEMTAMEYNTEKLFSSAPLCKACRDKQKAA